MKIVTFGEIMLRLQPYGYKRIMQAEAFEAVFGGGEANVCASLAMLGAKSRYLTALPTIRRLNGKAPSASSFLKLLRLMPSISTASL